MAPDPVDPDLPRRAELPPPPGAVLAAVVAGGVVGAEARYGMSRLLPAPAGRFPVGTLAVNVTGCLLIGVLLVVVLETGRGHPLARPFLGVGLLGGYTTFSGYAVDAQRLADAGHLGTAAAALAVTPVLALTAVAVAARVTRAAVRR